MRWGWWFSMSWKRAQSHVLIHQMSRYFRETQTGRLRSARVIPEPFFVHSDLTTGVQLADFLAYITAWGVRVGGMAEPARPELGDLADLVLALRYRALREVAGNPYFQVWSFAILNDLRPRDERLGRL
jgi:uncharacterized protein DUF3800